MDSNLRKTCILLLGILTPWLAYAQSSNSNFTVSAGYRGYISTTGLIDHYVTYSLKFHSYNSGLYISGLWQLKSFFLRPTIGRSGIMHSHGIYNPTAFPRDAIVTGKNVFNSNKIMEYKLDVGYTIDLNYLNIRVFAGGGWISTVEKTWETRYTPTKTISKEYPGLYTTLDIIGEAFQNNSYIAEFGIGWFIPVKSGLIVEIDVSHQTHISTLAVNSGDWRLAEKDNPLATGGAFTSHLVGAWKIQAGVGYRF